MTSAMYKKKALALLFGKWGLATLAMVILLFVQVMITTQLNLETTNMEQYLFAAVLFYVAMTLLAPLELGRNWLFLRVAQGENVSVGLLFENFGSLRRYGRAVLFFGLFYLAFNLLLVLLIVPGVWFYLAYRLTPFVMREEGLSVFAAMRESRRLMKGQKRRLIRLILSFFPWYVLVVLSGGIGTIFVVPYFETTLALFFLDIKAARKA